MHPAQATRSFSRYSPLQRIRPGQDLTSSLSVTDSSTSYHTLTSSPLHKPLYNRAIYGRAIMFFLFELSFLIFAYYCLVCPIPLPSNSHDDLQILFSFKVTLTEVKAGITAMSVVWHTLACLFIKDIVAVLCSAEFAAQHREFGELVPGKVDKVSTITSGLLDNLNHFISRSATGEFRLAFMVMLFTLLVGPLGSGTVTVGSLSRRMDKQIPVANLTGPSMIGPYGAGAAEIAEQSALALRLDRTTNTTFKYNMSSDGVLIPWPNVDMDSLPDQSTLTYRSDIVRYNYECTWVSNITYFRRNITRGPFILRFQFNQRSYNIGFDPKMSLLPCGITLLSDTDFNVTSSRPSNNTFLFFNKILRNPEESISYQPWTNLSLAGLSDTLHITIDNDTAIDCVILTCDPNSSVEMAEIALSRNSLTPRQLPAPINEHTLIGNIQPAAGNRLTMFSLSDGLRLNRGWLDESAYPERVMRDLFLQTRGTYVVGGDPRSSLGLGLELEPLPLDEISRNMNPYTQSAAKAYLNGITLDHASMPVQLSINQTAQISFPVAALVSSKPFLIVFTVVIGIVLTLLALLLWSIRRIEVRLFNLETLVEILGSK